MSNLWEKHYKNLGIKPPKNPPYGVRGIPSPAELKELLKNRVRVDPKKI